MELRINLDNLKKDEQEEIQDFIAGITNDFWIYDDNLISSKKTLEIIDVIDDSRELLFQLQQLTRKKTDIETRTIRVLSDLLSIYQNNKFNKFEEEIITQLKELNNNVRRLNQND